MRRLCLFISTRLWCHFKWIRTSNFLVLTQMRDVIVYNTTKPSEHVIGAWFSDQFVRCDRTCRGGSSVIQPKEYAKTKEEVGSQVEGDVSVGASSSCMDAATSSKALQSFWGDDNRLFLLKSFKHVSITANTFPD